MFLAKSDASCTSVWPPTLVKKACNLLIGQALMYTFIVEICVKVYVCTLTIAKHMHHKHTYMITWIHVHLRILRLHVFNMRVCEAACAHLGSFVYVRMLLQVLM